LEFCGELCDLTKEIKTIPGDVMGTVTAKVTNIDIQEKELVAYGNI